MGLFGSSKNSSRPSAPLTLPPLTQDRIIEVMKSNDWNYFIDSDGDLGGMWGDNTFHFMLRGKEKEVFLVSARWHGTVSLDYLDRVKQFISAWHQQKLWPKVLHRTDDQGQLRIFAEHAVDYEHGITDKQLRQHIQCALGTMGDLFSSFSTELESWKAER